MKKFVASMGLAALGASCLNAVHGQDTAPPPYKPWNVSATLRGFYDDNINTAPNGTNKVGSLGGQVSPGVGLDWRNDQTTIKANYTYTLRWYDKQPIGNTSHYDQDHQFDGEFDHAFSERYQLGVKDSFVVGQEPDFLRTAYAISEPQRVSGSNIRNNGQINFDAQLTPVFGLELGYANAYFDYADHGVRIDNSVFPNLVAPSLAGILNRMEHSIHVDGRFQMMPETVAIVGYQYKEVDFTGNEIIAAPFIIPTGYLIETSDARNSRAHYGYVGLDHNFNPDFSGSLRAGLSDTAYYNSPDNANDVSPYVMASLRYNYAVESYGEIGFSYDRNPTDLVSPDARGNLTLGEESAVVYGNICHRIIPKLYGSLMAQFQNSTFTDGEFNGSSERMFLVGLDLKYSFNAYLSADVGYNYDWLKSDVPEENYDRNRVYFGVTGTY
jgi:hypothetical protein